MNSLCTQQKEPKATDHEESTMDTFNVQLKKRLFPLSRVYSLLLCQRQEGLLQKYVLGTKVEVITFKLANTYRIFGTYLLNS